MWFLLLLPWACDRSWGSVLLCLFLVKCCIVHPHVSSAVVQPFTATLVPSQVVANVSGGNFSGPKFLPVGGHIMAHATTTRLWFKNGPGGHRVCKIMGSPSLAAAEASFQITADGIYDSDVWQVDSLHYGVTYPVGGIPMQRCSHVVWRAIFCRIDCERYESMIKKQTGLWCLQGALSVN